MSPLLSPTVFSLYIDELEKCLDEIDIDSMSLFNIVTVVAILLYIDDVFFLLFESRACLQRLLNKLHEFCTSSSFEVNIYED